jgi:hypothetical protein
LVGVEETSVLGYSVVRDIVEGAKVCQRRRRGSRCGGGCCRGSQRDRNWCDRRPSRWS